MSEINKVIVDSIKEGKWLYLEYKNKSGELTNYWCAIKDINPSNKTFNVDIFNINKSDKTLSTNISYDGIQNATLIPSSTYEENKELISKIEKFPVAYDFINYSSFKNNILYYLCECNRLDTDPYLKDTITIEGIDIHVLKQNRSITLNKEQENKIVSYINRYEVNGNEQAINQLAINIMSIDINEKKYVAIYSDLIYNPKTKQLRLGRAAHWNRTFVMDGVKNSLSQFVDTTTDDFIARYEEDAEEAKNILRDNLPFSAKLNTIPFIMVMSLKMSTSLNNTIDKILEKSRKNKLNLPLRAFFGNTSFLNRRKTEPKIVIFDNKVNIDQMQVIYNAIKQPITYVQGPPGTGKTQTILNVVLSAFFNEKTVLICSNNNKPVDGIIEKLNFSYRNQNIPFPYLRLGNNDEVARATMTIFNLYNTVFNGNPNDEKIGKIKDNETKTNKALVELLTTYERLYQLKLSKEQAEKLLNKLPDVKSSFTKVLSQEINNIDEQIKQAPKITNESMLALFKPAANNPQYLSYLYFESIKYLLRLKKPNYKELIQIVSIEEEETRVKQFNAWVKDDNNLKLLLNVFPIICSTNISASKLGTGDTEFDLVIMDEAGQCSLAGSLFPLVRANSLLLVGDTNQLRPVIVMDRNVNDALMEKYKIKPNYDYFSNSILSTMRKVDKISNDILLSYHYRCGKNIINFSNQRYYDNKLNLDSIKAYGNLTFLDVKNNGGGLRNSQLEESIQVINYIKRNNVKNAAIITPFVNQKEMIASLLKENNIDSSIAVGTIHSFQGDEKDTIIFSTAISYKTSQRTYDWVKDNAPLINVAITRSKNNFVLVGDYEAIKAHSKDNKDDLFTLCEYVKKNGEIIVEPSQTCKLQFGKSNDSKNEDEFFETLNHFCSVHNSFSVKRNVALSNVLKGEEYKGSKQEFDIVLYYQYFMQSVPAIVIELNGGEHFGNAQREEADKRKREALQKNNIKFISISNEFTKDYEVIRDWILRISKEKVEDEDNFRLFDID